jgi:hypothetical protein
MTEPTSFKSHNFDAVNEQIREIAKREKARTFAYRLKSFQTIFMYAAAVALIIAMLILVGAWAKRIISAPYYPPKTEIVRPEVIEKEVLKVVQVPVEKSIMETSGSGYEGPDVENTNSNTSSGGSQVSVVTNFNTFKTVSAPELSSSGISEVVTGWRFKDSESKYPEYQYCYTNKSTPGRTTTVRIELGDISEEGVYSSYIDSKLARETSVTQANLNKALEKCQWASA